MNKVLIAAGLVLVSLFFLFNKGNPPLEKKIETPKVDKEVSKDSSIEVIYLDEEKTDKVKAVDTISKPKDKQIVSKDNIDKFLESSGFQDISQNSKAVNLPSESFASVKVLENFDRSKASEIMMGRVSMQKTPNISDAVLKVYSYENTLSLEDSTNTDKGSEESDLSKQEEDENSVLSEYRVLDQNKSLIPDSTDSIGPLPIQITNATDFVFNVDSKYAYTDPKYIVLEITKGDEVAYLQVDLSDAQAGDFKIIDLER